jgi:hypothetical protein
VRQVHPSDSASPEQDFQGCQVRFEPLTSDFASSEWELKNDAARLFNWVREQFDVAQQENHVSIRSETRSSVLDMIVKKENGLKTIIEWKKGQLHLLSRKQRGKWEVILRKIAQNTAATGDMHHANNRSERWATTSDLSRWLDFQIDKFGREDPNFEKTASCLREILKVALGKPEGLLTKVEWSTGRWLLWTKRMSSKWQVISVVEDPSACSHPSSTRPMSSMSVHHNILDDGRCALEWTTRGNRPEWSDAVACTSASLLAQIPRTGWVGRKPGFSSSITQTQCGDNLEVPVRATMARSKRAASCSANTRSISISKVTCTKAEECIRSERCATVSNLPAWLRLQAEHVGRRNSDFDVIGTVKSLEAAIQDGAEDMSIAVDWTTGNWKLLIRKRGDSWVVMSAFEQKVKADAGSSR